MAEIPRLDLKSLVKMTTQQRAALLAKAVDACTPADDAAKKRALNKARGLLQWPEERWEQERRAIYGD